MSRQPRVSRDNQFFWDGVAAHEFRIQRCAECGAVRHPPRPMCPACQSLRWDTITASGEATLYSYVIAHRPHPEGFEAPYGVGLLKLPEGIRFVSNPIDIPPDELRIGMPVRLTFEDVGDGVVLPLFRRP